MASVRPTLPGLAFASDVAEIGGMEREILTVEEAAEFLRVDRKTVYVYVARRKIPHQRLGRRIILSRSALIAWIAAGPGSPAALVRSDQTPAAVSPPERAQRAPAPSAASPRITKPDPLPWDGPPPPRSWKDPVGRLSRGRPRTPAENAELKARVLSAVVRYPGWGAREYGQHLGEYSSEIGPSLYALVAEGKLIKTGQRRMTRYYLSRK
jgi:excisionase family DNA binding protein